MVVIITLILFSKAWVRSLGQPLGKKMDSQVSGSGHGIRRRGKCLPSFPSHSHGGGVPDRRLLPIPLLSPPPPPYKSALMPPVCSLSLTLRFISLVHYSCLWSFVFNEFLGFCWPVAIDACVRFHHHAPLAKMIYCCCYFPDVLEF